MNITIIRESLVNLSSQDAVGEYGVVNAEIHVDDALPKLAQRNLVIHAVIEIYCPSWPHNKVEELEEHIADALDKLGE